MDGTWMIQVFFVTLLISFNRFVLEEICNSSRPTGWFFFLMGEVVVIVFLIVAAGYRHWVFSGLERPAGWFWSAAASVISLYVLVRLLNWLEKRDMEKGIRPANSA